MDQSTRNTLRNVVTQCRRLLEESVAQVLQGQFGIYATGKKYEVQIEPEARMSHLSEEDQAYRQDLLDHYEHIKALGYKAKDALGQLIREVAFTHLNRFCAYRMMESRGLIRESVSKGLKSQGFLFYLADHEEDERRFNTGQQDIAYRHFLNWLGGTLSEEIGVLFAPTDPANRLYPPQRVIEEVLGLLNDPDLAGIWSEDEAIGWVYQYFTPKELRDQARKESQAPRNSYELAFRNQFFTPRYVVEFLTDNTLGRIWYEMRQGDTRLKDQCRSMVRRPTEVFLKDGEVEPNEAEKATNDLSQEELLKLPVYVPFRAKKDPREIRILDPACGSGHFLLYCFDLLLTIYEEAYGDPTLGPDLKKDYPTLEDLRRDVPRLILAHNLHGIDIDPRASQIAALALWLRCQRAYQEMGIAQNRAKITRSNFVCAEPMPGEEQMLKEFVGQLEPKVLGQVVEGVFDKMKLAGEAGSLLKIEEEIRSTIADAKSQWLSEQERAKDRKGHTLFFSISEMEQARNRPLPELFDLTDITDDQFFEQAESRVIETLRSYAEKAQNGQQLQRRLFSEDAVRGFAFVDLCHKRFDVSLMNPPFGSASKLAKPLISNEFPNAKNDLYAAFVDLGLSRLSPGGLLGAITSRTGLFLSSFQKWREECLLGSAAPTALIDLGYGVLDSALVETAAYCLSKGGQLSPIVFISLLQANNKSDELHSALLAINTRRASSAVHHVAPATFKRIPGSPLAYWISPRVQALFGEFPPFESSGREVRVGGQTSSDFQYLRLHWECEREKTHCDWRPFAKGGAFSPYYSEISLVVDWDQSRQTFRGFFGRVGRVNHHPSSYEYYFRPGLTFGRRIRRFSPACLPRGCVFSDSSNAIFIEGDDPEVLWTVLAFLNGVVVHNLISISAPVRKMEVGYVQRLPFSLSTRPADPDRSLLTSLAKLIAGHRQQLASASETSRLFTLPKLLRFSGNGLAASTERWQEWLNDAEGRMTKAQQRIDGLVVESYRIENTDAIAGEDGLKPGDFTDANADLEEDDFEANDVEQAATTTDCCGASDLLSYSMGAAFGRWDVRLATGDRLPPQLPDPFDALPVCPPGMLQGSDGHPLRSSPEGYPLQIDDDAIFVDAPDHRDDIVRRVREVLELIWKDRTETEAIETEACEVLGVREIRDYFRKPGKGGFWDDHVSRYSKSRRKAPIYWLLQSSKKNYAIWLYYHRLDKDILFKALVNYVEPKIRLEADRLQSLQAQKGEGCTGKATKKLDKEIEKQEEFLSELRDFEEKLRRAGELRLEPDLNDGVVLNIAPLHELVPWKEARNYWEELLEGKYEWSSIGKQLREKGLVT